MKRADWEYKWGGIMNAQDFRKLLEQTDDKLSIFASVETLNKYDCIECLLPTLQHDTIWKNSGRYEHYINDGTMLITESNKGTFCLAPTAEEAVVEFAREKLKSYKNLSIINELKFCLPK